MKVVCPSCGADFRLNGDKIPAIGLTISCAKCESRFIAYADGTTVDSSDQAGRPVTVPPPLPPKPPASNTTAPPPPPSSLIDFDDFDGPSFGADSEIADDEKSIPVEEFAPPKPLEFGESPSESGSELEVDDFDFSFGASDAPPAVPAAGASPDSPLGNLFDDLNDLPALKPQSIPSDFTDLPAPRSAEQAQEMGDIDDLPGLRMPGSDQPFVPPPAETPDEALLAPETEIVPTLPADESATLSAPSTVIPASADAAEAEESSGPSMYLIIMLALAVAGAAVGGLMVYEIGPFAKTDKPAPLRKAPKRKKVVKKAPPTKTQAQAAVESDKEITKSGLVDVSTFAEIDGFRAAIGALEQKKDDLTPAEKVELVELYAVGSIEYPDNRRWLQSAQKLLKEVSKEDQSLAATRARLAVELADYVEGAAAGVPALAKKHPRDAKVLRLLGHSRRLSVQREAALNAFKRAYALDSSLLDTLVRVGLIQLALGRTNEAKETFEKLYKRAPGAARVNASLAAILSREGNLDRARTLLLETLTLEAGRARPQDRSNAFLERARINLKTGGPALDDLKSAVRAWPGNLEALNLLSARQFKAGQYEEALDIFNALETAGARSAEISIKIGQCYANMGRRKKAISHLTDEARKYPESVALQLELGDIHLREQDYQQARQAYEAALKVDPNDDRALLKIGELLVREAKVDAALTHLKGALKNNPKSALMYYGLANLMKRIATTSGDEESLKQAESNYRQALSLDPGLVAARQNLVSVLVEGGKAEEGLKELERLQRRTDFHGDMSYELGRANQALGRLKEASKHYASAIKSEPENARFLKYSGSNHFERKEYQLAETQLEKAKSLDPKDIDVHYYLGRIAYLNKRYDSAVERFKQGLSLNKRNHVIRYWLGRSLEAGGSKSQLEAARNQYDRVSAAVVKQPALEGELCDVFYRRAQMQMQTFSQWQASIDEFSQYLKCSPKNAQAWFFRGVVKEKVGDLSGAVKDFKTARKLSPKMAAAYSEEALASMRLPKFSEREVRRLLKDAVRLDTTLAHPHFVLCNLEKERNRGIARRHCETYIKLDPKGDYAQEAKELLRSL